MHAFIGVGVRAFVLLCSAVVLGLSVTLAKQQRFEMSPPPETSFGSFTGAFGIITAAIGIAALFVDMIPSLVPMIADALTAIFFLAGGIAFAVALKGVSCTNSDAFAKLDRYNNKLLNGGCLVLSGQSICGVEDGQATAEGLDNELKGRCTRVQADFAFQFIAFIFALGSVGVTFLTAKRSGNVFA